MTGTFTGGKKAAFTNKSKYGEDFYGRIGAIGGKKGHTGGFAAGEAGRERARKYGRKGGTISRRNSPLTPEQKQQLIEAMDNIESFAPEPPVKRHFWDKLRRTNGR